MKNNSQPAGALLLCASLWCGVAAAQVGPSPGNITPARPPKGTPPAAPQPRPDTLHQEVRAWVRKTLIRTPAPKPLTFAARPDSAALNAADRKQVAAAKRAAVAAARKQAAWAKHLAREAEHQRKTEARRLALEKKKAAQQLAHTRRLETQRLAALRLAAQKQAAAARRAARLAAAGKPAVVAPQPLAAFMGPPKPAALAVAHAKSRRAKPAPRKVAAAHPVRPAAAPPRTAAPAAAPVDSGAPRLLVGPEKPAPVAMKPVSQSDVDRIAAKKWQSDESSRLARVAAALVSLPAPRLDTLAPAPAPARPADPQPETRYGERIAIQFVREDGVPFDSRLARWSGGTWEASAHGDELELKARGAQPHGGEVRLDLPRGWAFISPAEARLSLNDRDAEQTRRVLEPMIAAGLAERLHPVALFSEDQEEDALRATRTCQPPGESAVPSPFPAPAAEVLPALGALQEARRLITSCAPVTPGSTLEARRAAWLDLDQAIRLLGEAGNAIEATQATLEQLSRENAPRSILGNLYHIEYSALRGLLSLARARRAQYLAEALWRRAECEQPENPDRRDAVQLLRKAIDTGMNSAELSEQMVRYMDVSAREASLWDRIRAGEFDARPVEVTEVSRSLVRTLKVMRTEVDLRLREGDLKAGDRVTLASDEKQALVFQSDGSGWNTTVPRSMLRAGDVLRITRRTAGAVLEAEVTVPPLDPYAEHGNDLTCATARLAAVRSLSLTAPGESISLLEELAPVDDTTGKLMQARLAALRDPHANPDGSWWVPSDNHAVSYRLRPSPYPYEGGGQVRPLGRGLEELLRPGGRWEQNRKLAGRVIVDGIRLESPSAGEVAGLRVGCDARLVEAALGESVPRSGIVQYLDGALAVGLKDGLVTYIEIARPFADLMREQRAAGPAGTVTEIDPVANRLLVPPADALSGGPGAEFLLTVAGKPLPEGPNGEQYRALVVERTSAGIVCRLVRKFKDGRTPEYADSEVLRMLPAAPSGAVVLHPAPAGE